MCRATVQTGVTADDVLRVCLLGLFARMMQVDMATAAQARQRMNAGAAGAAGPKRVS